MYYALMNQNKSGLKRKWKCKEVTKTEFPVLNKELLHTNLLCSENLSFLLLDSIFCTDFVNIVTPINKTLFLFELYFNSLYTKL